MEGTEDVTNYMPVERMNRVNGSVKSSRSGHRLGLFDIEVGNITLLARSIFSWSGGIWATMEILFCCLQRRGGGVMD